MVTIMKSPAPAVLPILRSASQGRLLAEILLHPGHEFSITELSRRSRTPMATVVREVNSFEDAGIVVSRSVGRNRLVRAETAGRLSGPLTDLVAVSFGPPVVVADELTGMTGIREAYLHGSWAARLSGRRGPAPTDVDVVVVGAPDRGQLDAAADRAGRRLGLPVEVTVRSTEGWDRGQDPFVVRLKAGPLLLLDLRDVATS